MRYDGYLTRLFRFLSRYRGASFVERLARWMDSAQRSLDNQLYNMKFNGEERVLRVLKGYDIRTVFDVGANKGEWSLMASGFFPDATIFAFEMVPGTVDTLKANTAPIDMIRVVEVGLSTTKGTIGISTAMNTSIATAFPLKGTPSHDTMYRQVVDCPFDTGSNVMEQHQIPSIQFMKIDTEGMDLRVIKGFGSRLDDIDIIQFEYGAFNIASHDLLYDFYALLKAHAFSVGKIYPRSVIFSDYDSSMENFHGGNFLAVKRHLTSMIDDLADRSKF